MPPLASTRQKTCFPSSSVPSYALKGQRHVPRRKQTIPPPHWKPGRLSELRCTDRQTAAGRAWACSWSDPGGTFLSKTLPRSTSEYTTGLLLSLKTGRTWPCYIPNTSVERALHPSLPILYYLANLLAHGFKKSNHHT